MEQGLPLHLHGSNLVVDEELENELGWDIGTLDGQPFIAEDYVFGVLAYLKEGSQAFGWHEAVMLDFVPQCLQTALSLGLRRVAGSEMLQRRHVSVAGERAHRPGGSSSRYGC